MGAWDGCGAVGEGRDEVGEFWYGGFFDAEDDVGGSEGWMGECPRLVSLVLLAAEDGRAAHL